MCLPTQDGWTVIYAEVSLLYDYLVYLWSLHIVCSIGAMSASSSWTQPPEESLVLGQTFIDRIERFIAAKNVTDTYTLGEVGQPTTTLGTHCFSVRYPVRFCGPATSPDSSLYRSTRLLCAQSRLFLSI